MKFKGITNLDVIALIENTSELFRLGKYKSKKFIEQYIGLGLSKVGFYGLVEGSEVTALKDNQTVFDSPNNVDILIEGVVELGKVPVNNGAGNIVYQGYGILEVNGTVIYDGRIGTLTATWGSINGTLSNQTDLQNALDAKVDDTEKGAALGVATLDATGKLPTSQLPISAMEYKGVWNASTNSPALASGVGTNGDYYLVSADGTTNLDGEASWEIGDAVVFNGTSGVWQKSGKSQSSDLNSLTDVTTGLPGTPTQADDGKMLFYDFDTGQWITDDAVTHGTSVINCKKSTAGTIAKGLPVYLVGFDADLHTVELADATSGATMPVIGFTAEALDNTNSKHVTTFGKLTGIDTTSTVSTLNPNGETWVVNDALYMSTTAGGLTKVRPTGGTTLIQRIAKVLKVDATGGQIFVFNTARTAGLPNLGTDKLWIGDANGIPQEVDKSTIGGATGLAAIYDTSGNPTFYASLSAAITAASLGDTVVLWGNITETGATEIILKNGVDINLNGFTYEMSNASTTLDAFTDNNVSVDVTIYNGVIKRSGASGNNAIGLHILNTSSKVKLEGVEVQSAFGYCIYNQGTIDGGKTSNTAGNFAVRNDGGRMSNLINDGYGEYRQLGSGAEGYNIYSKASNYYGMFIDGGTIQNSYAESSSNEAFFIQRGQADNCVAVSSASFGIRTNGAVKLNNCKGYSSTSGGIFLSSSGAKAYYCVGESTANIGILINNGTNNAGLYNCTGISSASQGIRVDNGSRAVNCTGISTLNTTSGHGFDVRNNNDRVSGCYAEVTNAGAYGFNGPTVSPYIVDCSGRGMTTLLNIAGNSQTNTADAVGNILLQ